MTTRPIGADRPPRSAPFRWGLVGPGGIAHRFAGAVAGMASHRLTAVWGRDADRANHFVDQVSPSRHQRAVVHRSLEGLLSDPEVDAVYIATPHDSHAAFARAFLVAGKPVLCEKPLTPTFAQTSDLVRLARERRVFLMEALWTRFLPAYDAVRSWLAAGDVGELVSITSTFGFEVPYRADSRLFSPDRAGGALLDIGIYNLAVTRLVMAAAQGECPEPATWDAAGRLAPTGVDRHVDAVLRFPGGVTSAFTCSFDQSSEGALRIVGRHGEIHVTRRFWEATEARLSQSGRVTSTVLRPFDVNGFEYEIEAVRRAVCAGHVESAGMPHDESLAIARWLDALRRVVGVRYPFESASLTPP